MNFLKIQDLISHNTCPISCFLLRSDQDQDFSRYLSKIMNSSDIWRRSSWYLSKIMNFPDICGSLSWYLSKIMNSPDICGSLFWYLSKIMISFVICGRSFWYMSKIMNSPYLWKSILIYVQDHEFSWSVKHLDICPRSWILLICGSLSWYLSKITKSSGIGPSSLFLIISVQGLDSPGNYIISYDFRFLA